MKMLSLVRLLVPFSSLLAVNIFAAQGAAQEVFVRFRSEPPQAMSSLWNGGIPLWRSSLVRGLFRYRIPSSAQRDVWMAQAKASSRVFYVEPNYMRHRDVDHDLSLENSLSGIEFSSFQKTFFSQDPLFDSQWALQSQQGIHPQKAWEITRGRSEISVAIIDTGVESDHPDLQENVSPGWDVLTNTPQVRDPHGHGTHVAGIIAARSGNGIGISGIAGRVKIIPIRAVPEVGDESDAHIIEAIEKSVALGARIANCSFGKEESSQAVAEVFTAAGERGLFIVAAAGNDGDDLNQKAHYPASFATPNMIVVASYDLAGRMASSSNIGVGKVDLAAPGVSILSTYRRGRYQALSGTSMAAPHVSGVAALLLSLRSDLTPYALRRVILESTEARPAFLGRVTTGGALDASRSIGAVQSLE